MYLRLTTEQQLPKKQVFAWYSLRNASKRWISATICQQSYRYVPNERQFVLRPLLCDPVSHTAYSTPAYDA